MHCIKGAHLISRTLSVTGYYRDTPLAMMGLSLSTLCTAVNNPIYNLYVCILYTYILIIYVTLMLVKL